MGKKTYNSEVCVKGLHFNEYEVNYYGKLEEVIKLKYHIEQIEFFIYLNTIGMISPIEESKLIPTTVWSELIERLDFSTSTMASFYLSNANHVITHTLLSLERIGIRLIGYP